MAGKYDITSGLTEYKSMYHDVGVDKYIDAVQSLRETYDRNTAGMNLVKEGVQQMEFMPKDDEVGRAYLSDNINSMLEGAVDAPEEATQQVNRAASFFTSDAKAGGFRRNAKEWLLTKQTAMNTPGGWSSMIMFGDNPFEFQTVNEDGSLNVYNHQAEGRLDQEGKFLDMVGQIAKDTSIMGAEYQDLDSDGIMDVITSGSSTGVSNNKADRIVDGIMEQYINTPEGKQAMRELMEPIGGKPIITADREEAKRMLLERMRPLIQNQVGFTKQAGTAQITGGSKNKGFNGDLFNSSPSMLLQFIKGEATTMMPKMLDELGMKTGTKVGTTKILTDYASVMSLGYLKDVGTKYAIVPGWKPFENLQGDQKTSMAIELMKVLDMIHNGDNDQAMELAKSIPGFSEAMRDNDGAVVMEGLETFYKSTTKLGVAETRQSLGALMDMNINGGTIVQNAGGSKTKSINRNGETVLAIQNRVFITEDGLDNMADQDDDVGTAGWGYDWGDTDINNLKHPGTGKNLFTPGSYDGEDGYFVDVWTEMPIEQNLQHTIDRNTPNMSASDAEKNQPYWEAQIKQHGQLAKTFQTFKQEYIQDGTLYYQIGENEIDGMRQPKVEKINIGKYVTKGSVADKKIRHIFDIMPEATVAAQMSQGQTIVGFSNLITTRVRRIMTMKQSDKEKQNQLQELIEYLKLKN